MQALAMAMTDRLSIASNTALTLKSRIGL